MSASCKFLIILKCLVMIISNCSAQEGTCTKVSSCKCTYQDGAIVDLTPLANTDGSARYSDKAGSVATTLYSWNPCNSFTEGTCQDVAVCQLQEDLPPVIYESLGSQDSAKFTTDDQGQLAIQYSAEKQGVLITTLISLLCDSNSADTLTVTDERKQEAKYFLELSSPHCCPSGIPHDHLSVGTYITIIFLSFASLFFVIGISIQKCVRKKTGKDVIPFVEFWIQLPGLVKAGVLLILCRSKQVSYETY
ncbi:uncharacterized protein LOC132748874 [Ruditapes philippinarum]|uniref:uncharacterized protein LOC132748874 n=1 Tax=Ruditapes philippinarum TaxID=129788 RepID=UPI00295BC845|nr:uncharacterized protein LOC132748874 [Ruditapes philippinarum]